MLFLLDRLQKNYPGLIEANLHANMNLPEILKKRIQYGMKKLTVHKNYRHIHI